MLLCCPRTACLTAAVLPSPTDLLLAARATFPASLHTACLTVWCCSGYCCTSTSLSALLALLQLPLPTALPASHVKRSAATTTTAAKQRKVFAVSSEKKEANQSSVTNVLVRVCTVCVCVCVQCVCVCEVCVKVAVGIAQLWQVASFRS